MSKKFDAQDEQIDLLLKKSSYYRVPALSNILTVS